MKSIKSFFTRILQTFYLTTAFYFKNNLDACASACAFNFIFSFIPILVIILTVFVKVLHISPAVLEGFDRILSLVTNYIDVHKIIAKLPDRFIISWGNLFLVLFIVWMARKLFLSVIKGLGQIFHTEAPARPVLNQILTFAGELLAVITCAIVFFAAFIMRQIFTLPFFSKITELFPLIFSSFSSKLVNWTLFTIILTFTVCAYKFASGSNPKKRQCLFCGLLTTGLFYGFIFIISIFMNRANYNTIYGFFGKIIILLFEVYVYFVLFMYFAQMLYALQFFNSLLLGELYFLPKEQPNSINDFVRKLLFVTPFSLMTRDNLVKYKAGQEIFKKDDYSDYVYYIVSGIVCEYRNEKKVLFEKGSFCGEYEFLLNTDRTGSATAIIDCTLIKIPALDFSLLLKKNTKVASIAMSKLVNFKKIFD